MFTPTAPLSLSLNPTRALFRKLTRLRLTTKQVNGGFYKGNRTGAMGRHTKHGGYIIDPAKVRTYVVPEGLEDCKLSPFVTKAVKKPKFNKMDARLYLQKWKEENGTD